MKNLNLKIIAIIAFSFLVFACSKDGAQGPAGNNGINGAQGPAGNDGNDGAQGQTGNDGNDGEDGNANIMYSDWINYLPNDINIPTFLYMRIPVQNYTQNFVDSGGFFLCFIRWQDNVQYQLPFSQRFNSTSSPIVEVSAHGVSSTEDGEIRISCQRQDAGIIQTEFLTLISGSKLRVRYFLIKGTINLRIKNGTSIQDYYKSKTYEEICTLTGAKL